MRLREGALAAGLCVLGIAGVAGASTQSHPDRAGDVSGGGGGDYDLVEVSHGHQGGFLLHKTRTRGPHTDDSPAPEFFIRVGAGRKPDFRVTAAGVYRINTGRAARRVGDARLVSVDSRTFKILFRPAAINNPRRYQWRVYMGAAGSIIDRAPAGYVTHVLR